METIIEIRQLKVSFEKHHVLKGIDLSVYRNEIFAIVGGSGSGKSTILRSILMLNNITSGSLKIFGEDITHCTHDVAEKIRRRWGVLFQSGALFSSLTLLENVAFPLREYTGLDNDAIIEIAKLKISMVGLPLSALTKKPSELSGGMQKRAALARAIVLDPELLFLDEPTSGLDPESAGEFDDLILTLQEALGLTVVMVTHDMDSLSRVPDRIAFLGEGLVLGTDSFQILARNKNPIIQSYFSGPRVSRLIDKGEK
jgi:phospholipid/cholesterol/gamma-HCH transport system ATP-binding protein